MAVNKKLVASYLLDCVVLIVFAGIGGGLNFATPTRRLFSLTDPSISFPNYPDTISVFVLFLIAVVAPAAIISVISLLFLSSPTKRGYKPSRAQIWRRKLWELFTGLLGLAFAIVLGFFLTQALKNLFGKPRPDFLARCRPNLVLYTGGEVVGGFESEGLEGNSVHTTYRICDAFNGTAADLMALDDGFRSFPSGHCTIAFAGLVYLSLYLCSKLSAFIPHLPPSPQPSNPSSSAQLRPEGPSVHPAGDLSYEGAAPPIYLFVVAFVPTAAAIYVASTRFTDYKHHGFDIIFSSFEGILCAWLAFRWYHLPVRRGMGWAWAPRTSSSAFGIRVGTGTYRKADGPLDNPAVGREPHDGDIELGRIESRVTGGSSSSRAHIIGSAS